MKILRMSDRIKIKCGEIEVKVSPIDHAKKIEVLGIEDSYQKMVVLLKDSLKSLSGASTHEGNKYELTFDDSGKLTDDCAKEVVDALLQTNICPSIVHASTKNFDKIEGVEFEIVPN